MNPTPTDPMGPADPTDDADDLETLDEADESHGDLPLPCAWGMTGWCGQLRQHARCYFNHPDGIAAIHAGTYGRWDGHQWVCPCPCHDVHDYPPCPHPGHDGAHKRRATSVDHPVQSLLF